MLDRNVALGARYFRSTKLDRHCELIFLPFFRDSFEKILTKVKIDHRDVLGVIVFIGRRGRRCIITKWCSFKDFGDRFTVG